MATKIDAIVLVKLIPGFEEKALSSLRAIPDVKEVHLVYGQWDAVVEISAETIYKLANIVLKQVRGVQGIADTETLIVTSA
jgi:DNA-binding Lrp family transcriptional regulator